MLRRRLIGRSVLAVLAGLVLSLVARGQAQAPHRALRAALYHLKEAREEVRDERFKRYRERIERDVNTAIIEVERAMKEGRIEARYEPPRGWDEKYKSFKHLRQALVELGNAKIEIREEKGEWARRRELVLVIDEARAHIEEALREIK
jgi:hypothetical protein